VFIEQNGFYFPEEISENFQKASPAEGRTKAGGGKAPAC
jgi:hypothetical protein